MKTLTLAPAAIDSGGGITTGGALVNHGSIGEPFATGQTSGCATLNHNAACHPSLSTWRNGDGPEATSHRLARTGALRG